MADRGTRFTNYSSIHSKDAFIGDYQVMYTPGSSPPVQRRKASSSRFSANARARDPTQSIIIPSGIPDTSAILPSRGTLRDVHVHYTIPADEKEIVASLRKVQKDLDTAMDRIVTLEQERDVAREELRASRVEEELFDISRVGDGSMLPSPQKTPKNIGSKRVSMSNKPAARNDKSRRASSMRAAAVVEDESIVVDATAATAASNTSRRRYRASLDENMTSAYILPDITVPSTSKPQLSKSAQAVLHDHDPQHIAECRVCQRLTSKLTHMIHELNLAEPTVRPRIAPAHALAHLRKMLNNAYDKAKQEHGKAWREYDAIHAPNQSKRHMAVADRMHVWAKKMEEARLNLDQLRDVEEGLKNDAVRS
ncbi:hypothetical protein DV738_g3973, partial [Chaetothyriales sp. CBS 135597]